MSDAENESSSTQGGSSSTWSSGSQSGSNLFTGDRLGPITRPLAVIVVSLCVFAAAMALSRAITVPIQTAFEVGDPGSATRLVVNVVGLQIVGFGVPAAVFLYTRREHWLSYLRVGDLTQWVVFYGTAVGLTLMLLTVIATLLFNLLGTEPAEAAVGQAQDPLFYVLLFVVSTSLVVPMEELFFRGIIQRYLTEGIHAVVGIALASLLFASIHSSVSVGAGGEWIAFGMFVSFGIALGLGYHLTENLLVPIIGHAMFNGIQILVRALEVAM